MRFVRLVKKILCLTFVLLFVSYDTVSAASISASLSSDKKMVLTTFNTDSSGYHVVSVFGYEYNSISQKYISYTGNNSVNGGGNLSMTHHASKDCTFVKTYDGIKLRSAVYLNGALKSVVTVD